jgi:hypothetical protein
MARPRKKQGEVREKTLGIRVSPAEYESLKSKAQAAGQQVTTFIRLAALDKPIKSPIPKTDMETYKELCRIGNNLNQLLVRLHMGIRAEIHPGDIEELKNTIETMAFKILGVRKLK